MTLTHRVLHPHTIESLDDYVKARGGTGWEAAREMSVDAIIAEVTASGLRGRGGAGFPTGRKWQTVREYCSNFERASVVVNAAEGEPGTLKDRTIIRNNPYQVIEGALIGARAVAADQIIIGTKRVFAPEIDRLQQAIEEMKQAGWIDGVAIEIFRGPEEYLYGEETALLETIDGRYPFPRTAPPYRRGMREVVESAADLDTDSNSPAHVEMAARDASSPAPPTLVENVETLANIGRIIARGADWFRTEGTQDSPGTIVCTITGSTRHAGVAEVMMGTTLREAIELIGGGARDGRRIVAVLPGVSNALLTADKLDTPLTYEDMAGAGSGLGSGGYMVLDDNDDLVSVVAGVSRFLAVESCGQCSPCKLSGLGIADALAALSRSEASATDMDEMRRRVAEVTDGARCSLATQQQVIVASLLDQFGDDVAAHLERRAGAREPAEIAELRGIDNGVARIDERHAAKQPDWTYNAISSGKTPAERLDEHRDPQPLEE
jgi:NADH:ubiquinone oxidoreductase subunit F (NADH-binding)